MRGAFTGATLRFMRNLLVVLAALLVGCGSVTTEIQVRDAHLIEVRAVTDEDEVTYPFLSALEASKAPGGRCGWRDEAGFPHFCFGGPFEVRGASLFVDAAPEIAHGQVRLRATLPGPRRSRRSSAAYRPSPRRALDFVTPLENVISLTTRTRGEAPRPSFVIP